jgi:hypothetical protein
MAERLIALYLSMKRLAVKQLHQKLIEILSLDIVIYSMITWYLCKAKFDGRNQEGPAEAKLMSTIYFGGAIVKLLADSAFSSMYESSTLTYLPSYTAHRSLTRLIDSTLHYLHWIPHILPVDQEPMKASLFRELLRVLQAEQASDWNDIVTLDES